MVRVKVLIRVCAKVSLGFGLALDFDGLSPRMPH